MTNVKNPQDESNKKYIFKNLLSRSINGYTLKK